MTSLDPAAVAREIIDAGSYLTLATADAGGSPWATPVWFAHDGFRRFVWVSRPGTRHSGNVEVRSQVAFVIFDSNAPIGTGQGVYAEATAALVDEPELDRWLRVFSDRAQGRGGRAWTALDVVAPSEFRLYLATVTSMFVLDEHDARVGVEPWR